MWYEKMVVTRREIEELVIYCTISFNMSPPVMRDGPDEYFLSSGP